MKLTKHLDLVLWFRTHGKKNYTPPYALMEPIEVNLHAYASRPSLFVYSKKSEANSSYFCRYLKFEWIFLLSAGGCVSCVEILYTEGECRQEISGCDTVQAVRSPLVAVSSFPVCRSQCPSGLRRSAADRLLGIRFRIPPEAWIFVLLVAEE